MQSFIACAHPSISMFFFFFDKLQLISKTIHTSYLKETAGTQCDLFVTSSGRAQTTTVETFKKKLCECNKTN